MPLGFRKVNVDETREKSKNLTFNIFSISMSLVYLNKEILIILLNERYTMNTSHKDDNIAVVTSKLIGLILKMPIEDRRRLLSEVERQQQGQKNFIRRKYDRQEYLINIDYTVSERFYNGFAVNLSANGAFIESPKNLMPEFSQGDQIVLSFDHPEKKEHMKITGEVARIDNAGFGVMFDQAVLDWWTT
jgi:hypothetical protein